MRRAVVSLPAENRLAAIRMTSSTGGSVPSGKVACAISVMTSSRGLRAAVLDVARELLVEEAERLVLQSLRRAPCDEVLAERVAVVVGHAEEVGDHHQRERDRVVVQELALARVDELVDRLVGERPHERLVLLEALRRDEPHEQPAVRGVLRRVERGELVAERQLVAVLLDDLR